MERYGPHTQRMGTLVPAVANKSQDSQRFGTRTEMKDTYLCDLPHHGHKPEEAAVADQHRLDNIAGKMGKHEEVTTHVKVVRS